MAKQKHDTSNIDNLLASVTADMLGDGFSEPLADNSIRVERFLLDMVRRDPVQPRRVLPEQIHRKCLRYFVLIPKWSLNVVTGIDPIL